MTPPPDHQVAALREAIRRAGRDTRTLRLWTGGVVFAPLAGLAVLVALLLLISPGAEHPQEGAVFYYAAMVLLSTLWGVLPFAMLIALPLALAFRSRQRLRLGRLLVRMNATQREAVLLPLRSDPGGDTRKIVAPLLREFGLPTELTPAAAPEGRGREVTAERPG